MTKQKKKLDYIEVQLEFDPSDLGGTIFNDYDVRVFKTTPQNKNNVALTAVISKKEKDKNESLRNVPTKTIN